MKLKSIVTTMIIAGAASSTAFAADGSMQAQLDAMKAQMAQMQAAISANNAGNNLPTQNWFNRISIGGMLNVDGNIANRSSTTIRDTRSPSQVAINNANLFVDAQVSDWTKAHIGLVYGNTQRDFNLLQANSINSDGNADSVNVDEAYATIGNFAKNPFYLKAGKQYMNFGSYKPYADITPSLTQALSQVNATGADVGVVATNGIHADIFGFGGMKKATSNNDNTTMVRNMGLGLGYDNMVRDVGVSAGVQYLYNMADVTAINLAMNDNNSNAWRGYTKAVGGIAANLGVTYKAFDAAAKYVSAVKRFDTAEGIYSNNSLTQGARPSAWGLDAGYSFPVRNHTSRFGLGYQGSRQTAYINTVTWNSPTFQPNNISENGFSKARYLANYTVNVSKYTDLGFEIRHDKAFSISNGSDNRTSNTGTVRLAVKFA